MRLSDHRPTVFDHPAGSFFDADDPRREWIVAPVIQTRDSGPLDQSNFASALAILGGESETVEVHRFGHWGPGWYEIIIADPAHHQTQIDEITEALENYPVLDDEDHSQREWEAFESSWDCYERDFIRALVADCEAYPGQLEHVQDLIEDHAPNGAVMEIYQQGCTSGELWTIDGDQLGISDHLLQKSAKNASRDEVIALALASLKNRKK